MHELDNCVFEWPFILIVFIGVSSCFMFFFFLFFAVPFPLLYLVLNWYVVSAFWNAFNSINYSKHELLHWSWFAVTWCNVNGKTHKIIMTFGIKILTLDAALSLALSLSFDLGVGLRLCEAKENSALCGDGSKSGDRLFSFEIIERMQIFSFFTYFRRRSIYDYFTRCSVELFNFSLLLIT